MCVPMLLEFVQPRTPLSHTLFQNSGLTFKDWEDLYPSPLPSLYHYFLGLFHTISCLLSLSHCLCLCLCVSV
jgi:hypothetical protein